MSSRPADIAIIIAAFSALLSAFSLVISYRTFRRAGPRIKIIEEYRLYGKDTEHNHEHVLRISNNGLGPIQITNWWIEAREKVAWASEFPFVRLPESWRWRDLMVNPADYGPSLPYTLNGNHEVTWTTKSGDLDPAFRKIHQGRYQIRSRTMVTLGTGKTVRCRRWVAREYDERAQPAN
jgi:hypothetical protein